MVQVAAGFWFWVLVFAGPWPIVAVAGFIAAVLIMQVLCPDRR
jgi:hypothetical protein